MSTKETVTILGSKYAVHRLEGTVVGANRHVTTSVSGGGGYVSAEHGGSIAPVHSSNSVHDTLFLKDKNGQEHVVRVTDVLVDCREGHALKVAGPVEGRDVGYLVFLNENTGIVHGSADDIRKFHQPSLWRVAAWTLILGVAAPHLAAHALFGATYDESMVQAAFWLVLISLLAYRHVKGRRALAQVIDSAVYFK